MAVWLGLGLGVTRRGGGVAKDDFVETFDANIDGWATAVGTGTLQWTASDAASHNPGPYTGVMEIGWVNPNDHRVRKAFSTKRSTDYRLTVVVSFLASGDRATVQALKASTAAYATATPLTNPTTVVHNFTTDGDVNGDTTIVNISRFGAGTTDTVFVDSVRLQEL